MPNATDCYTFPINVWDCQINSSNVIVFNTRFSLEQHPGKITIESKFVQQLLHSKTLASPGPGRTDWTWSDLGIYELLQKPSSLNPSKPLENMDTLYGITKQKTSLRAQCGGDVSWFLPDPENPRKSIADHYFARGHYAANSDY